MAVDLRFFGQIRDELELHCGDWGLRSEALGDAAEMTRGVRRGVGGVTKWAALLSGPVTGRLACPVEETCESARGVPNTTGGDISSAELSSVIFRPGC